MRFRTVCLTTATVAFVLVPALAFAQSWEWEGWNGDWDDWRDTYRDEVEDLGDDIVEDMPIPVLVGVERSNLTKNFGDPRGGGTRTHEGLDIVATDGTPIASPTAAIVMRTGDGADSGLYVRTVGPGGETFVYMHLSKIAERIDEGDVVERGEIIGFVGNTGNARGGHAHLHLEIRQDGEPVDPYPRLTEVFSTSEREDGLEQALDRGGDDDLIALLQQQLSGSDDESEDEDVAVIKPTKSTLVFGATNSEVRALQEFLIAAKSGDSSTRLANTGATGYFGPLTQAALREYQREAKLEVTGVVDTGTYALIFAQQDEPAPEVAGDEIDDETGETPASAAAFTRDLEVGVEGEDVKALQEFLNTNGFVLAAEGPGSPDNETEMFGGLTRAALAKFQAANDIAPAIGYFGPITRGHILAKLALN